MRTKQSFYGLNLNLSLSLIHNKDKKPVGIPTGFYYM